MSQLFSGKDNLCPSIVDDINHRICEGIRNSGIFLFSLSDNLISEDWFFAEGERFLCFCFSPPSIYPLTKKTKGRMLCVRPLCFIYFLLDYFAGRTLIFSFA